MIPHSLVKELGFKRQDIDDTAHDKVHGWKYFIMTKKIKKGVHVEWSPVDQLATFWNTKNEKRFVVEDPSELEVLMGVLG